MPEGPEVETVRRDLERLAVGSTIDRVRATGRRSVRRYGDGPAALAAFEADVAGLSIVGTGRLGKYVWLQVSRGNAVSALIIHLRMSGQVRWHQPSDALAPHTHIVLMLDSGAELRFVDPRTFGEVWRTDNPRAELSHIGPDAVEAALDAEAFVAALRQRRSPTKAVLLDQGFVAGIGNIYSDEICFRAGIRSTRRADTLTKPQARRIAEQTVMVLSEAIERRGSSLRDQQYVDLLGFGGAASSGHCVYDRLGQPCLVCGRSIERTKVAGRSSYFCRSCQR
jgi:formamidopyrimidine-DNA glycosylase